MVWWDPSLSLSALCHIDFLPPGDLKGSWDLWKTRKENTLALAKALQSFSEWSSGPYSMVCGAVKDLQGCMANLMWLMEEDVLDIPLLEPVDDLLLATLTPEEEATLLCESQEAQATATCSPRNKEWAPESKSTAKLGEAATELQGMQVCPPPPGFESLPLDVPLIGIPNPDEVLSTLSPISTMNVVLYKSEVMGDPKYEYKTFFISRLYTQSHLIKGSQSLSCEL